MDKLVVRDLIIERLLAEVKACVEPGALRLARVIVCEWAAHDGFVGEIDRGEVDKLGGEQQAKAPGIFIVADPKSAKVIADELAEIGPGTPGEEGQNRRSRFIARGLEVVVDNCKRGRSSVEIEAKCAADLFCESAGEVGSKHLRRGGSVLTCGLGAEW